MTFGTKTQQDKKLFEKMLFNYIKSFEKMYIYTKTQHCSIWKDLQCIL